MDNNSYVALSRAMGLRKKLDVIANNIANANTTGFKSDSLLFSSFMERAHSKSNAENTAFTQDIATIIDETQGALSQTGNPLDVAINGNGWFGYMMEDGSNAFGRDGRFNINSLGTLVNLSGNAVLDIGGGQINIAPEDIDGINISTDGTISNAAGNILAQIGVFDVEDFQNLERIGGGMLKAQNNDVPLIPSQSVKIAQGFVEGSNVQSVVEITRLMDVQKSYERSMKVIENEHERIGKVLNRLGRSAS